MTIQTLNENEEFCGFSLIKTEEIPELKYSGSNNESPKNTAYELRHTSGAKILYLENDDPEMGFSIGFKTLPKDSTGVFHILEHSVLCGSRKFPVKEPFTNLLKSSMQTFLNAMTFPDKTIYPVASTNEKDLYNLIDVYMDAVLYPNIYINKNIFLQEGGHETLDGFSGVVYNEMQGVYSDPQEHIFEGLMQQLFPESCYAYSSGGSPEIIKKLTYEEYLAQHNTNYRLDNSYIILYGNLDIRKMLSYLDKNYLSKENDLKTWRKNVNTISQGSLYSKFNKNIKPETKIVELQTNKENAECGAGFVFERDHIKMVAVKILIDALCSSNESPLKKALLDDGFASDIDFDLLIEVFEPFVIVECKSCKKNSGKNLVELIQKKLIDILQNGIEKKLIIAAISNYEFKLKEKNPTCTNGLDAAINLMSEWLYNDDASTNALKYNDDIAFLKNAVNTDYFDELAKEVFIDNKHYASVEIVPTNKSKADKKTTKPKNIEEVNQTLNNLELWQANPDKPEDEAKIPVMDKHDIGKINNYPIWDESNGNFKILHYDINTNGITYLNRYYPLNAIKYNDIFYVSILCSLLGKLDTDKYSSSQIDLIWQEYLGSLNFSCKFFENFNNPNDIDFKLSIKASALNQNADYLAWFIDEIILNTKFDDYKKIKTILLQNKVDLEQSFISAGHKYALSLSLSSILPVYEAYENTAGIKHYQLLKDLLDNFDKEKYNLSIKLQDISKLIFRSKPHVSFAGIDVTNNINNDYSDFSNELIIPKLTTSTKTACIIPSNVNYCACTNDVRLQNLETGGCEIAASKIISLEYLWNEVRVKNGAYGSGMLLNYKGTMQFYSYRDPKVKETFLNFNNSANWLKNLNLTQRTLDNFIISTIAKIDAPVTNLDLINHQDNLYFSKADTTKREEVRNQILNTTLKDIKNSAEIFNQLLSSSSQCIFGSKDLINLKKESFKIIDLFEH